MPALERNHSELVEIWGRGGDIDWTDIKDKAVATDHFIHSTSQRDLHRIGLHIPDMTSLLNAASSLFLKIDAKRKINDGTIEEEDLPVRAALFSLIESIAQKFPSLVRRNGYFAGTIDILVGSAMKERDLDRGNRLYAQGIRLTEPEAATNLIKIINGRNIRTVFELVGKTGGEN